MNMSKRFWQKIQKMGAEAPISCFIRYQYKLLLTILCFLNPEVMISTSKGTKDPSLFSRLPSIVTIVRYVPFGLPLKRLVSCPVYRHLFPSFHSTPP